MIETLLISAVVGFFCYQIGYTVALKKVEKEIDTILE